MKVLDCYANSLNNCEGPLTEEHIISKSLLGDEMKVNLYGLESTYKRDEFVVSNLCQYHNNYLSSCEAQMKDLIHFLATDASLYKIINTNTDYSEIKIPRVINVKGAHLEKWLVKTAINYSYLMNNFRQPRFKYAAIVKRLFGNEKFERDYGISLIHSAEQLTDKYEGGIYFEHHTDEKNNIYGIVINLQGFLFLVYLPTECDTPLFSMKGITYEKKFYAPENIEWHGHGIAQKMFDGNGDVVTRSKILIKW